MDTVYQGQRPPKGDPPTGTKACSNSYHPFKHSCVITHRHKLRENAINLFLSLVERRFGAIPYPASPPNIKNTISLQLKVLQPFNVSILNDL